MLTPPAAFLRRAMRRWEALEAVLREVVDVGGDMANYWQRWRDGRWWWFSSGDQLVFAGPGERKGVTCKRARAAGLVS